MFTASPASRILPPMLASFKCAEECAGELRGTGSHKIGNVHLKWDFSEEDALFLRHNSRG